MINLVIFDLDGVLANTESIHYESLCDAIYMETNISYDSIREVVKMDGSTTKSKLKRLQGKHDLFDYQLQDIDKLKQEMVLKAFKLLRPDPEQIKMLTELELLVPCLAVGSNSRKENVNAILEALRIKEFFTYILAAEDVHEPKPEPEVFERIMEYAGAIPTETLILEDSEHGHAAAIASGAHLLRINSCDETNLENIIYAIKQSDNYSPDGGNGVTLL